MNGYATKIFEMQESGNLFLGSERFFDYKSTTISEKLQTRNNNMWRELGALHRLSAYSFSIYAAKTSVEPVSEPFKQS